MDEKKYLLDFVLLLFIIILFYEMYYLVNDMVCNIKIDRNEKLMLEQSKDIYIEGENVLKSKLEDGFVGIYEGNKLSKSASLKMYLDGFNYILDEEYKKIIFYK